MLKYLKALGGGERKHPSDERQIAAILAVRRFVHTLGRPGERLFPVIHRHAISSTTNFLGAPASRPVIAVERRPGAVPRGWGVEVWWGRRTPAAREEYEALALRLVL